MSDLQIRGYGRMTIGGEVRPFHLGTFQARVFCEQRKVELSEYQQAVAVLGSSDGLLNQVLLCDLLYSALVAGAKRDRLPCDFDADDVSFWFDEAPKEEVVKLIEVAIALNDAGPVAPGNAPGPKKTK